MLSACIFAHVTGLSFFQTKSCCGELSIVYVLWPLLVLFGMIGVLKFLKLQKCEGKPESSTLILDMPTFANLLLETVLTNAIEKLTLMKPFPSVSNQRLCTGGHL